jgi:hypothetical protein
MVRFASQTEVLTIHCSTRLTTHICDIVIATRRYPQANHHMCVHSSDLVFDIGGEI